MGRLLGVKGNHLKCIKELEGRREVDVKICVREESTVVKLPAGSMREFPGVEKPLCWCPRAVAETAVRDVAQTIQMPMM